MLFGDYSAIKIFEKTNIMSLDGRAPSARTRLCSLHNVYCLLLYQGSVILSFGILGVYSLLNDCKIYVLSLYFFPFFHQIHLFD